MQLTAPKVFLLQCTSWLLVTDQISVGTSADMSWTGLSLASPSITAGIQRHSNLARTSAQSPLHLAAEFAQIGCLGSDQPVRLTISAL